MGVVIIDAAAVNGGFAAGVAAKGEFHCAGCGYGIVVHRGLPACPMCHGSDWRPWASRHPVPSVVPAPTPRRA
jgi:hypothetical protein